MTSEPEALLSSEEALARAVREFLAARTTGPFDDMTDSVFAAIGQVMKDDWGVEIVWAGSAT